MKTITMKTIAKVLVGATLVLALSSCSDIALRGIIADKVAASAATIRVGSVAESRVANGGWTLDGAQMVFARSKLLNPANFGPNGTVKKTITITDTTATITTALLSQFDVFFIGYIFNGTLSGPEVTAMTTWVSNGGVMIVTADDDFDNDVSVAFGYTMPLGSAGTGTTYPDGPGTTHPVFVGPFGTALAINGGGTTGIFFGSVSGEQFLGYDLVNSIYTVFETPYGSGRVLFLADVDFLSDDSGMTPNNTINPANGNDVFLGNVFAYAHK